MGGKVRGCNGNPAATLASASRRLTVAVDLIARVADRVADRSVAATAVQSGISSLTAVAAKIGIQGIR